MVRKPIRFGVVPTHPQKPQALILCTDTSLELAQIAQTLGASLVRVTPTMLAKVENMLAPKNAGRSVPSAETPADKPLSARERDLLRHLATGLGNQQIARIMGISHRTVESHRQNIKRKLRLTSQTGLILYAVTEVTPIGATDLNCVQTQFASMGANSSAPSIPKKINGVSRSKGSKGQNQAQTIKVSRVMVDSGSEGLLERSGHDNDHERH